MNTRFLLALIFVATSSQVFASSLEALREKVLVFDETAAASALDGIAAVAQRDKDSFRAQWEAAEGCRMRAAQLRDAANMDGLNSSVRKDLTKRQVALAKRGAPFAEGALALAADDEQRSRAHRVLGELAAMEINGMISGMRKGPVAESNIERALALRPEDPENLRASGVMYLYRPSFVGGDVAKAVEVFRGCHERDPASDVYLFLLAVAHHKNGDAALAAENCRKSLAINPAHRNAAALLENLTAS